MYKFIFIIVVLIFSSCRNGVRPEAGLDVEFYRSSFPQLTTNSTGFWYVVTPMPLENATYAVIESDDVRKAFYVIPRGKRTAQILPISPGTYSFLDPLRDGQIKISFTNDPEAFKLSDSVGWWKDGEVKWLGEAPKKPVKVALMRDYFDGEVRLSTWLVGQGVFDGKSIVNEIISENRESYFVVPDGDVSSNREKVVNFGGVKISEFPEYDIRQVTGTMQAGYTTRFSLTPFSLQHDAEILVYEVNNLFVLFSGTPKVERNLGVGVTEVPLVFRDSKTISIGIRALHFARAGNYLSSLQTFLPTNFESTGGNYGGRLREMELSALGGYIDWARFEILDGRKRLNADDALAIARMHIFSGEIERAGYFVDQAITLFQSWKEDSNSGLGAAFDLRSRIKALKSLDKNEVAEDAGKAASYFEGAGDDMRAAEQEARIGALVFQKDNVKGIETSLLARSRFYHGHSEFYTAMTELDVADAYAEAGDRDKALEMVGFARERLVKLKNPAALNRVDITVARIEKKKDDLYLSLDRALKLGDLIGAADAAATVYSLDPYPKNGAQLLVALSVGLQHMTQEQRRQRALNAVSKLCDAQRVAKVKSESSLQALSAVVKQCKIESKSEGKEKLVVELDPIIQAGYSKISNGDTKGAEDISKALKKNLTESLRQSSPFKAAQILLFEAAILKSKQKDSRLKRDEAIELIRRSVEPTKVPVMIRQLMLDVLKYNQIGLAADLAESGTDISEAQKQTEELHWFALRQLELRHESKDIDLAMRAAMKVEPIFQRAGEKSAGLLSILSFYRGDLLYASGKSSLGSKEEEKAVEYASQTTPLYQIQAYVLATELALGRGLTKSAKKYMGLATKVSTGSAFSKNTRGYVYSAWVSILHGHIQFLDGRELESEKSYSNAKVMMKDANEPLAYGVLIKALRGMGVSATNDAKVRIVVGELEKLQEKLRLDEPHLVSQVVYALAEIRILSGRADDAKKGLQLAGLTGNATLLSACWWGRSTALSGEFNKAKSALKRCADSKLFPSNYEAKVLTVLLSNLTTIKKTTQISILSKKYGNWLTKRQKKRLGLIEAIAKKSKQNAFREEKMKVNLSKASDGKSLRWASEKYANFLIESGRPKEALSFFEQKKIKAAFYEGEETHSAMVRLRVLAHVRTLQPISAMNYIYQVGDALDEGITKNDQTEILLQIAQHDFVLALWGHAKSSLNEAYYISNEAKDGSLKNQVQNLSKSFGIQLNKTK